MNFTQNTKFVYLYFLFLSFILYGNTIPNGYSLDDGYVVTENASVQKGFAGIPEILTQQYGVQNNIKLDYRPIVLTSFAVEYQLFGEHPHVSHFINVLLYSLCLLVLYIFLSRTLQLQQVNRYLPLIIVILFAVHPLHTEVVASLKNRDELFCFIFGFLFLISSNHFIQSNEKRFLFGFISIVFFILTIFSKLVGILYIPVFILLILFQSKSKKAKLLSYLLLATICIFLGVALYFILTSIKRETYSFENSLVNEKNLGVYIATCLKIIGYHLSMLVYPNPLRYYYGFNLFPLESKFEISVLISALIHLFILVYGIYAFAKKRVIGFIFLSYLACISLYSNFPIPYTGMYSERAQFLSSSWFIAGIIVAVFYFVNKINKKSITKFALVCLAGFTIFYSFLTIKRNFYWKNSYTLMEHDMPNLENSVAANYIYANNLYKQTNSLPLDSNTAMLAEKAIYYYKRAYQLYPYYPEFLYYQAQLYQHKLFDTDMAVKIYKVMLQVDSTYSKANFELGKYYFDKKDYNTSYPFFKHLYMAQPKDTMTLFYLAKNALAVHDLTSCYAINQAFLKTYPNITYPYMNLGVYYSTILKDDSAVIYFDKAIQLGERNPDLLNNMVIYYYKKNNLEKAKYYQSLVGH